MHLMHFEPSKPYKAYLNPGESCINKPVYLTKMPGVLNKTLAVNDGPLTAENAGLLRASEPSLPLEELRKRYDEDGYLFVKGLLPRADVLETRKQYFDMIEPTGVLEEGSNPVDGIFNHTKSIDEYPGIGAGHADGNGRPGGDKAAKFVDLAIEAHYKDWYAEKLAHHPDLYNFVAKFTGWNEDTLTFRRSLLRNNIPGSKPIGVHYDQIFLRHGEPTSVTAWVPIGDIALEGGGLIYLEDGTSSILQSSESNASRRPGWSEGRGRIHDESQTSWFD